VTNSTRDDRPTPGPNELVPTWPEYRQLREAVHAYLDHDPDDPKWADIWRALGAILGEYQRDAFVQAFDVFEFASEWGLEVSVLPKSWYNIGSTVHIVFYPPERYR